MRANAPHDTPSTVNTEAGQIMLDGPDGLAAAFTPDAAEETGKRLVEAAEKARRQGGEAAAGGDGADGRSQGNSLKDLSDETVREMQHRRDGAGHAGTGDLG